MSFKDYIKESLLTEKKVTVNGKEFKSSKEAGLYLGSIGKTSKEIMKMLNTTELMANYYARKGATRNNTPSNVVKRNAFTAGVKPTSAEDAAKRNAFTAKVKPTAPAKKS